MSSAIPGRTYNHSPVSKHLVVFGRGWGLGHTQVVIAAAAFYTIIVAVTFAAI